MKRIAVIIFWSIAALIGITVPLAAALSTYFDYDMDLFALSVTTEGKEIVIGAVTHVFNVDPMDGEINHIDDWYGFSYGGQLIAFELSHSAIGIDEIVDFAEDLDDELKFYHIDAEGHRIDLMTEIDPMVVRVGLFPGTKRVHTIVIPYDKTFDVDELNRMIVSSRIEWWQIDSAN